MKNLNKIVLAALVAVAAMAPQKTEALWGLTTLKNGLSQIKTLSNNSLNSLSGLYAIAYKKIAGQHQSTLNLIRNITKTTPLHLATKQNLSEVKKIVENNGTKIDAKNWLGETSVHSAVKRQDLPMVRYLTYYGANLGLKNVFGKTAFDLSKKYKNKDIVEFLKDLTPKKEVKE